MDHQIFQALVILFGLLAGIASFFMAMWVRNIWAMVLKQQEQLGALSLKLAEGYVPRAELEKTFERIFSVLEEIRKEMRHPQT